MNTTISYTLKDSGCAQEVPARRVIGAIRDWYARGYDFGCDLRISKNAILRAFRAARKAEKAENPAGPVDLDRLAYWYSEGVAGLVASDPQEENEWLAYMTLRIEKPSDLEDEECECGRPAAWCSAADSGQHGDRA